MFDIPEKGKDIVLTYLKEKFEKKKQSPSKSGAKPGVLDNLRKKHNLKTCCCQNPSLSNFKPPGLGGAYTGKRYLGSRILE